MDLMDFQKVKAQFKDASVDDKIDMYVSTEGLTQTQYRELLKMFPMEAIGKLESALSN